MITQKIAPGYYKAAYNGCEVEIFKLDMDNSEVLWGYTVNGGRFQTTQKHEDAIYTKKEAIRIVSLFIDTAKYYPGLGWCVA